MIYTTKYICTLAKQFGIKKVLIKNVSLMMCKPFGYGVFRISHFHSSKSKWKESYYEILQIKPKATKNQIKKAYYRLSLTYHPDQNKSESATIKFREITEAYEVLSDPTKRKLYDRGMLGRRTTVSSRESGIFTHKVQHTRAGKSTAPTEGGREQIFDFDEWSKKLNEENFNRRQSARRNASKMANVTEKVRAQEKGLVVLLTIIIICFAALKIEFIFFKKEKNDVKDTGKL